jgi:hypothetical protein
MKNFPIPALEILPVAVRAAALYGCRATVVEVSSTRDPVVAPAGTVLRAWLSQTLEAGPGTGLGGVGLWFGRDSAEENHGAVLAVKRLDIPRAKVRIEAVQTKKRGEIQ